jgi:hypothetical protein
MQPRPLNKPPWLLYAEQVRTALDAPTNNSRRQKAEAEVIMETYAEARRSKGYKWGFTDWTDLLTRLAKSKRPAPRVPPSR